VTKNFLIISVLLTCLLTACAGVLIRPLEYRELRIDPDNAGFYYRICLDYAWYNSNKCRKWKVDRYDLTDKKIRKQLIDMGFTATVNK